MIAALVFIVSAAAFIMGFCVCELKNISKDTE